MSMKESTCLLSRQPVYCSGMTVMAYELRSGGLAADSNGSIFSMFTDSALDLLVGERPGIVSLTPQALSAGSWKPLSKSRVVLGYFEEFGPSDPAAHELAGLLSKGYRVAISGDLSSECLRLLDNAENVIKLDVTKYLPDDLERRVSDLRRLQSRILAENVNTYDDLEFCKSLEFDFYQGHFLCKPAAQKKEMPVNRMTMLRLLSKLQDAQTAMPDLEALVSQDVSLSYKLLRYANSAAVALPRSVNSVGHAVRLIGMEMLRTWSSALLNIL